MIFRNDGAICHLWNILTLAVDMRKESRQGDAGKVSYIEFHWQRFSRTVHEVARIFLLDTMSLFRDRLLDNSKESIFLNHNGAFCFIGITKKRIRFDYS